LKASETIVNTKYRAAITSTIAGPNQLFVTIFIITADRAAMVNMTIPSDFFTTS
jgi:hypothetical protein